MPVYVGNGMGAGLIQWRCQRREHRDRDTRTSPVFLLDGAWAYCEAGQLAPNHEFLQTGGMSRERVEGRRSLGDRGN